MPFSNAAHVTKVGPWIVTGEAAPGCAAMKVFSSVTAMFRPTYPHTQQLWPWVVLLNYEHCQDVQRERERGREMYMYIYIYMCVCVCDYIYVYTCIYDDEIL